MVEPRPGSPSECGTAGGAGDGARIPRTRWSVRCRDLVTSSQSVRTRRARPGDSARLGALNVVVQQVHHTAFPGRCEDPDADAASGYFAAQLVRPAIVGFLADEDEKALCLAMVEELRAQEISFSFAWSTLYLHHLAVVDASRHRGIGRLSMSALDDEARRLGVDEIRLDFWSFNSSARGLSPRSAAFPRYLLRALILRAVTDHLARRHLQRPHTDDGYRLAVELAIHLTQRHR